jgi:competence protein ComEA
MSQPPVVEDWTYGPARWIGVGLVVALSAVGLSWSLTSSRATPAAAAITTPTPTPTPKPETPRASALRTPAALAATRTEFQPKAGGPIVTELPATAAPAVVQADSPGATASAPVAASPAAKINVNTATLAELESLPGIGPKLAQRILDDRAKNGLYRSLKDLDRVSGIGPKTLERLAPRITFD